MKLTIIAIGRGKGAAEHALAVDYCARAAAGRRLGFSAVRLLEAGGGKSFPHGRAEAEALLAAAPEGAVRVLLDEAGAALNSREMAGALERWKDEGRGEAVFFIAGADGADPSLRAGVEAVWSLGRPTWPHLLVRALIAEQIYRAVMILSGTPYHRD